MIEKDGEIWLIFAFQKDRKLGSCTPADGRAKKVEMPEQPRGVAGTCQDRPVDTPTHVFQSFQGKSEIADQHALWYR
ncbi:hypothetical protein [Phyllobacterium salinisoli]|nr:hypothetical protein [Phyllobacterium salinisoli]